MSATPAGTEEPDLERDRRGEEGLNAMCKMVFLIALGAGTCVPCRAPLVLAAKKGDAAATGKTLGLMSSIAASIEFIINPTLGRLSDKFGRKPFISTSLITVAMCHSVVALVPTSLPINFMDRCISGAALFAFFNPIGAALQDLFSYDLQKLGMASARFYTWLGLGFALGPLIGAKLGPRNGFTASTGFFALAWLYTIRNFKETLEVSKRKEFDIAAANPLSFVGLFKTGVMAKLMTAMGFSSLAEYPNIYDINFLYLKTVMGYGPQESGYFATGFGVTQMFGGLLSKKMIGSLGLSTYTVIGHGAYVLGFMLLGSAKGVKQLVLSLLILMLGHQRGGEPASLLSNHAAAQGMGRGEIQGAQANFLAVLKVIAPTMYGRVFALGDKAKFPGLPYFLIAAFIAAAQLNLSTIDAQKKIPDGAEKKS